MTLNAELIFDSIAQNNITKARQANDFRQLNNFNK